MQSGIVCDDNCIPAFSKLKMDKTTQYIIFKIQNDEFVVVEKEGDKGASYDEFVQAFPEKEARYGVFDYHFVNEENRNINKLMFVFWCPAGTKMQDKFKYAGTKEEIKSKLQGLGLTYEARTRSELDKDIIEQDLAKF